MTTWRWAPEAVQLLAGLRSDPRRPPASLLQLTRAGAALVRDRGDVGRCGAMWGAGCEEPSCEAESSCRFDGCSIPAAGTASLSLRVPGVGCRVREGGCVGRALDSEQRCQQQKPGEWWMRIQLLGVEAPVGFCLSASNPPPSPTLSSLGPLHPNPGPLSTALPERKGPLIPSISKQMGPWGKGGGGWGGGAQRAGAMRSLRCPLSTQFCANSVKSRAQRSSAEPPPLQVPGGVTHTAQPFCCATTNGAPSCSFPEPPRSKTPTPGASSTQRIRPSRTACTAFRRTMPTRGVLGVGQSSARSCLQTANPVGRYLFALWPPARC